MKMPNRHHYLLLIALTVSSVAVSAADFIELTVDPANSDTHDADKVTLLINRDNVTHVEIKMTKTPERAWYKLIFHHDAQTATDKEENVLFMLDCNSTETVKALSAAIRNGSKNAIDAVESCRLTTQ